MKIINISYIDLHVQFPIFIFTSLGYEILITHRFYIPLTGIIIAKEGCSREYGFNPNSMVVNLFIISVEESKLKNRQKSLRDNFLTFTFLSHYKKKVRKYVVIVHYLFCCPIFLDIRENTIVSFSAYKLINNFLFFQLHEHIAQETEG